jgi:hypothetical protein
MGLFWIIGGPLLLILALAAVDSMRPATPKPRGQGSRYSPANPWAESPEGRAALGLDDAGLARLKAQVSRAKRTA